MCTAILPHPKAYSYTLYQLAIKITQLAILFLKLQLFTKLASTNYITTNNNKAVSSKRFPQVLPYILIVGLNLYKCERIYTGLENKSVS